jgi:malonyl-CoA O-methyltransferase
LFLVPSASDPTFPAAPLPQSLQPADGKLSAAIDPLRVRRLFARPARVRDSDFLRREIAGRMFERLELVKLDPKVVLDAGCGEGADLPLLQQKYLQAHIIGQDAAPAMLAVAAERAYGARSALNRMLEKFLAGRRAAADPALLAGDFANLPFKAQALDLVWSNLALHWHPQPDRVFAEWRRVINVDGLLMFSCFGPDTFKELRLAFGEADLAEHALPFVDMHDFGDMLVDVGFSTPVMDIEKITVTYDSVAKLMSDVRAWGGNPLRTGRKALMGRRALGRVAAALQTMQGADGRIPLTFEVIYGHAFRPAPRKTAAGESIIRFDLPKK